MNATMTRFQFESDLPEMAYSEISNLRDQLGRKYDRVDIESGEYRVSLRDAAMRYVQTYTGRFDFILDLRQDLCARGALSAGQLKGALNCIATEWVRIQKEAVVKEAALISTPENVNPTGWTVPDGRYTVVHEDESYQTLRLRTCKDEQAERYHKPLGTRMAQYLSGPDNSNDYILFAWIYPNGRIQMKGDYKTDSELMDDLKLLLAFDSAGALDAAYAYAKRSNRCSICGADLTNPDSIDAGMGPVCRGRFL